MIALHTITVHDFNIIMEFPTDMALECNKVFPKLTIIKLFSINSFFSSSIDEVINCFTSSNFSSVDSTEGGVG